MCLRILVQPLPTHGPAKRRVLKPVANTPFRVTPRDGVYEISPDGTCACELLADDADWNDEVWRMDPDKLAPLARTIEIVLQRLRNEARVEAQWSGVPAREESTVSPGEFIERVLDGRLGTRTSYRVMVAKN